MDAKELIRKAQCLFVEGKHKESVQVFTEAMAAGGESEILLLSRGVAQLKDAQIDRAIEDFSRVIDINKNNVRAYFYRGITYLNKGLYEMSIADLDRTIEIRPEHGAAFFARATAYAQLGNKYEATRNIRTAISISKRNVETFTDTLGIFRTRFDEAMNIMAGRDITPSMTLTEDEINVVKKWLEEKDN